MGRQLIFPSHTAIQFLVKPNSVNTLLMRRRGWARTVGYVPFFRWGIMNVIRHIPEFIFKKMNIQGAPRRSRRWAATSSPGIASAGRV